MPRMKECRQCRESFQLASLGRPPTYCSATCRKKAWEARQIAAAVDQAVDAERQQQRAIRGNETAPRPQAELWPVEDRPLFLEPPAVDGDGIRP